MLHFACSPIGGKTKWFYLKALDGHEFSLQPVPDHEYPRVTFVGSGPLPEYLLTYARHPGTNQFIVPLVDAAGYEQSSPYIKYGQFMVFFIADPQTGGELLFVGPVIDGLGFDEPVDPYRMLFDPMDTWHMYKCPPQA